MPMATLRSQQIAQARQQLRKRERLGQIVIAALFEPTHSIVNRPARREDQHWRANTTLAQAQNKTDTIQVRQAKIDDENVVGMRQRKTLRTLPSAARSTS